MDPTSPGPVTYQNVRLCRGAHRSPADGACVMELVSLLAGERFTDRPQTACPVIGAFLRPYNDIVCGAQRQDLLEIAASVVDTRRPEVESARIARCAEFAVESYRAQTRWWRALDGARGVLTILDIAAGPVERADLDRLGYHLARVVRRSRDGRERAIALVDELAAMRTPATVEPRVALRC